MALMIPTKILLTIFLEIKIKVETELENGTANTFIQDLWAHQI